MKRTAVAVGLAVAALALLVSLVLQSRSVPIDVHLAHNSTAGDLQRVGEDYDTLIGTLRSAWESSQAPGQAARSLLERIASSPDTLGKRLVLVSNGSSQQNRVRNAFEGFEATVTGATTLAGKLIDEQTAYAEGVTFVRESGPQIVQQMRDIGLDRSAADTFQLIAGTLDFARPQANAQEYRLRRLLVTLGRDQRIDANMPAPLNQLRNAVDTVLGHKATIRSELDQLAETPVKSNAVKLSAAADDLYRATLATVDRARTLLSVYAVLLLAAATFIAYRLQGSYRDLNRANSQLESMNLSLEQGVKERTAELEEALHDLKESQVQLVQAEKMSSLGQLVAGISHEINTPLLYLANNAVLIQERLELMHQFVKNCTEAFSIRSEHCGDRSEFQAKFVGALKGLKRMLRDEELEASVEEARDLAKDSIEGLGDLTEMAQSLKDFSRLDRAPIGSFDVNAGLEKTLLIAKNIVKHKASVSKLYGDVPEIECSPSQINQVFLNLITNAAQAIEKHGEIVITTKLRDASHVAIVIADTGSGISEENLSKIRDPFFTTKGVGGGTGLGLSIVDEIIRSHNGQLLVESEPGKGSVFTVVLPIKQQTAAAPPASTDGEALADDAAATPLAEAV